MARVASSALLAGAVGGLVAAGLGGRLAMRIVAVQSSAAEQGMITDHDAATGEVTLGGSLFLIAFVTVLGTLGGLVYVLVRPALPVSRRPLVWGVFSGLVAGTTLITSEGVDYTVLGSRWVSVAMFAAVGVGYGSLTAWVAERRLRPDGRAWRAGRVETAAPFVLLVPGLAVVPVTVALAGVVVVRATGLVERLRALPVTAVVRTALVLVAALAALDVAQTVAALA